MIIARSLLHLNYLLVHGDRFVSASGKIVWTEPLYFAQANVLYRIRPDLWVASGGGYAAGGANTVNGIDNNDPRENILWGAGIGYSFTPWMGVKFQYIRSDAHNPAGMDSNRYLFAVTFTD